MILIADGGSTKVDWVILDKNKQELFRTRSRGLNPALLSKEELHSRIINNYELTKIAHQVKEVHFFGAGCGTSKPTQKLQSVLEENFKNAKISVAEDMLAAVYAASKNNEAIVCILGTGSNSCYYDGKEMHQNVASLGYILMDEASGNYFGKKLLQDYFYKRMPKRIAQNFAENYDLSPDEIKKNLYQSESPNAYLGQFGEFMFQHKESTYMHQLIADGFREFIENRILPYQKAKQVPVYFIGSIAHFFNPTLQKVCDEYKIDLQGVIRRPIDELVKNW